MNYYLDIELRESPEISSNTLLSALFSRLHKSIVSSPNLQLAVSFPSYSLALASLGECLRIHGSKQGLDNLTTVRWLGNMKDHVALRKPMPVPENASHIKVRRVQNKVNVERFIKRSAKRKGIPLDEARENYKAFEQKKLELPYLILESQSTGQRFSLFIEQSDALEKAIPGEFNSYGLSSKATVPWF